MVDIVDKEIQRAEALAKSRFDVLPIRWFDNPRYDVEGKDLLMPVVSAIDAERHPHVEDDTLCRLLALLELPFRQ